MTRRIYLLRHGIAMPQGTPGVTDDDRSLTSKGEGHVKQVARGLSRLGVAPCKIVTSPLPRARRTAEIVARVLKEENGIEDADALRPGATAGSIRDWLKTRTEDRLMLVGHNPNLTELLGLFLGLSGDSFPFELKKGGLAELRSDGQDAFQLQWLATPRFLRKLQG